MQLTLYEERGLRETRGTKGKRCKIKEQGEGGGKECQGQKERKGQEGERKGCPGKGTGVMGTHSP